MRNPRRKSGGFRRRFYSDDKVLNTRNGKVGRIVKLSPIAVRWSDGSKTERGEGDFIPYNGRLKKLTARQIFQYMRG